MQSSELSSGKVLVSNLELPDNLGQTMTNTRMPGVHQFVDTISGFFRMIDLNLDHSVIRV